MRTLIIENNIINQSVLDEGINLVKQDLSSINFPIEITRQVSNKLFNTEVRPNGYWAIKTTDIAPMGVGYNFSFLIYDATKVCPTQPDMSLFHPEEYGNVMQMSCQWFNNSPRVFADFFLHEIAHMLQQGKKDLTHLVVDRNLDPNLYDTLKVGQMQHKDFYLYLIKNNMPTSSNNAPVRTLKKGMTGTDVMSLQKDLRTLGYFTYPINTLYFGSVTDKAVKAFQKANGLVVDGIVGSRTSKAIAEKKTLKSKTSFLDLSKWKLTYDCEQKARQFLTICKADGYNIKITSGYRSQKEQDKLYSQGRTDKSKPIVTYAKVSEHTSAKAFDIAFEGSDPYPKGFDWEILGKIGESVGLKWGGRFSKPDCLHFQIK